MGKGAPVLGTGAQDPKQKNPPTHARTHTHTHTHTHAHTRAHPRTHTHPPTPAKNTGPAPHAGGAYHFGARLGLARPTSKGCSETPRMTPKTLNIVRNQPKMDVWSR